MGGDGCDGTASIEDVWAQFGMAGAQDAAQQYGSSAAGFQGYAASGSSEKTALLLGQGLTGYYGMSSGAATATQTAAAAAAGGSAAAQQMQQQMQQQGDLSWLLEQNYVPGSPTLAALLRIDSPLGSPRAGGRRGW